MTAQPRPLPLDEFSRRSLESALSRLDRFREHVDELSESYRDRDDMPGTKTVLTALGYVLVDAERTLVERGRRLAMDPSPEHAERFHSKVGTILGALERTVPPLLANAERVHGREIEALVAPITRIAKYIDEASEVILAPGPTYHVDHDQLAGLVQFASVDRPLLERALESLPGLTVISYPAHLAADTLLHAVLAHEVAHIAYLTPLPGEEIGEGERIIDRWLDVHGAELLKSVESRVSQPDSAKVPLLENRARQRVKRWFLELACDRLAVTLVGPTFVFALFDIEGPRHRWHQSHPRGAGYDTHPGLAWRLRRVLDEARTWLPTDVEHDVWEAAGEAFDAVARMVPEPQDALDPVERKIIEGALEDLDDRIVREMLRVADYEPGVFHQELPVVWDKLRAGIPPSEWIFSRTSEGGTPSLEDSRGWSQPVNWQSILAGSYVYWLAGRARSAEREGPPSPYSLTTVPDWNAFNALVRGSIELAELHRALSASREKLNALNPK